MSVKNKVSDVSFAFIKFQTKLSIGGQKRFTLAQLEELSDIIEGSVMKYRNFPIEYKGVAYYPNRKDAELRMGEDAPDGRIVEYLRGYAIQIRVSGPYLSL